MSTRTIERYRKIFRETELAGKVMNDVTNSLVDLLDLNVTEQRLDSTHVFSNMATFGRTRLMGVTVKRFLTQVKRHGTPIYESLPEELRMRYQCSESRLFADTSKGSKSFKLLRRQVAEDMYFLIEHFIDDDRFNNRGTFRNLCTVFEQQCKVTEEKVDVNDKPGGNVIQNPSDPDATYDGHKGPGYQVQFSETCSDQNEVQLITCAIPETACEHDSQAVEKVCFEKTEEFKEKYRKRSRIEGTNSGIKRRTGMGRLRVRGRPDVFNAILLKTAGWNILQAARSEKVREYVRKLVPWNSEDRVSAMIESCVRAIRGQIRSSWKYFHLRIRNTHRIEKYQFWNAV
ncbi:MAG: transposase [Candidatus Aegiribacteria sp.]|nr:transposase [Candidatus Aegiribacteria sp.]